MSLRNSNPNLIDVIELMILRNTIPNLVGVSPVLTSRASREKSLIKIYIWKFFEERCRNDDRFLRLLEQISLKIRLNCRKTALQRIGLTNQAEKYRKPSLAHFPFLQILFASGVGCESRWIICIQLDWIYIKLTAAYYPITWQQLHLPCSWKTSSWVKSVMLVKHRHYSVSHYFRTALTLRKLGRHSTGLLCLRTPYVTQTWSPLHWST